LIATPGMIAAIDGLRTIAPQFESVIGIVANAAAMSLATGRPLQIPPIMLLGQPGIGKTFFAKRLAAAIRSAFLPISMNLAPAFGLLAGLSPAWKGAGAGKIATTLVDSPNAAPVILFDEVEKVVIANAYDRPLDVLHSLWEPENAVGFRDEYYDIPFDASHVISIATANATEGVALSLLDRPLVLDINPPTFEQRRAIALQVYGAAVRKTGDVIEAKPSDAILDLLAASTPRRITRLIGLALPMAVASKRHSLSPVDINAAAALLDSAKVKEGFGIGFIRRESRQASAPIGGPDDIAADCDRRSRFPMIFPVDSFPSDTLPNRSSTSGVRVPEA
jgi:ATP-dependent Lon protease